MGTETIQESARGLTGATLSIATARFIAIRINVPIKVGITTTAIAPKADKRDQSKYFVLRMSHRKAVPIVTRSSKFKQQLCHETANIEKIKRFGRYKNRNLKIGGIVSFMAQCWKLRVQNMLSTELL